MKGIQSIVLLNETMPPTITQRDTAWWPRRVSRHSHLYCWSTVNSSTTLISCLCMVNLFATFLSLLDLPSLYALSMVDECNISLPEHLDPMSLVQLSNDCTNACHEQSNLLSSTCFALLINRNAVNKYSKWERLTTSVFMCRRLVRTQSKYWEPPLPRRRDIDGHL